MLTHRHLSLPHRRLPSITILTHLTHFARLDQSASHVPVASISINVIDLFQTRRSLFLGELANETKTGSPAMTPFFKSSVEKKSIFNILFYGWD